MKLTKKQLEKCEYDLKKGKGWRNKKEHCLRILNQWNLLDRKLEDSDLEWFFERFVPMERSRINRELHNRYQSGDLIGSKTPTDLPGRSTGFNIVTCPRLGQKYHVSWAYRGALFVLEQLDPDGVHGYLNNPKNKRKKLLKVKLEDLRHLKGKTDEG